MKAKDVIIDKISWKESRNFFFHRLRRLITEQTFLNKIIQSDPKISISDARSILKSFFETETKSAWKSDHIVFNWFQTSEKDILNRIEREYLMPGQIQKINSILNNPADKVYVLKSVIESLPPEQIKELISKIQIQ